MTDTTMPWHAEALWQQLQPLLPGLSVEVVRSINSTNSTLLERARASPDAGDGTGGVRVRVRRSIESSAFGRRATDWAPCLLVAEQQLAGRGRQGRVWQSQPGSSLTFSLGVGLAAGDWSGLSLAVGVALCEALAPAGAAEAPSAPPRLALKWPNDLWLMDGPGSGRKLGGILIETVTAGSQRLAVIGVGLNVRSFEVAHASTGVAALQEIDAAATAPDVLARVALPLVLAVKQFEREGFAAFVERYAVLDLLRGHTVLTTSADAAEGLACGVSAQGALLLQTAAGLRHVSSGEVSVRLGAQPLQPAA